MMSSVILFLLSTQTTADSLSPLDFSGDYSSFNVVVGVKDGGETFYGYHYEFKD